MRCRCVELCDSHSLAAIDVSGPMAEKVAGSAKTRVQLTIETADGGLKMFWTRPSSGCGSFRRKIGLDGAEFKELGPIGRAS